MPDRISLRSLISWLTGLCLLMGVAHGQTPPDEIAPAAETPATETPAAETPAAETPAAETPAAETPASQVEAPPAAPHPQAPEEAPAETVAEAPEDAPLPNQASGVAQPEDHSTRDGLLWVPRVLLFVPKVVLQIVFVPLRALAWAFERFDYVISIFTDVFFTDDRRFGAYPTALFETGFGLNFGARVEANDLTGYGDRWRLRAGFGGRFRQIYQFRFRSGRLLGDLINLEARLAYNISANKPFYGIGNGELVDFVEGDTSRSPYGDELISARYRENRLNWGAVAGLELGRLFSLRLSNIWEFRTFANSPDSDFPTAVGAYDESKLTGYEEEIFNVYNELAITFSTLAPRHPWISRATPSGGWQITTFGGHAIGVSDDPTNYFRTGIDIEHYIDLAFGDRVLMLRGFLDTTIGTRGQIPFDSYPALGGGQFLRGYPLDRFRDRIAGMLSAEYMYALNQSFSTYFFTDIGRVWSAPEDIAWRAMRQTYGGGIQFHTLESFVFRVQIAASQEGDFFVELNFNPINQTRGRF